MFFKISPEEKKKLAEELAGSLINSSLCIQKVRTTQENFYHRVRILAILPCEEEPNLGAKITDITAKTAKIIRAHYHRATKSLGIEGYEPDCYNELVERISISLFGKKDCLNFYTI